MDKAYARCKAVLTEHRSLVDALVKVLLEKETVDGPELYELFTSVRAACLPAARLLLPAPPALPACLPP